MTLTQLDVARAGYLWALQQHKPTMDDQLADVASIMRMLTSFEQACSVHGQAEPVHRQSFPIYGMELAQQGNARRSCWSGPSTPPAWLSCVEASASDVKRE